MLEKELRSMRTEVTTSVQSMEQKEMNINIEYVCRPSTTGFC